MPPLTGRKTDSERFAGAVRTYSCEAMMQDNRALQAGTSHNLGQNFSRQFELKFQAESGGEEYAWNTSWGVSTRLVGGLVMTHGDDAGLVVPPKLAAVQAVIVPIFRSDEERILVLDKATQVSRALTDAGVRAHVDMRDSMKPGPKFYEWERKGVPFRIEIGPKDVASEHVMLVARVAASADAPRKEAIAEASIASVLPARLHAYQNALLKAAIARRERNSHRDIADYGAFRELMEGDAGFVYAGWCGSGECEARVKADTKATARVIPSDEFRSPTPPSRCFVCGQPAADEVVWARAY